MVQLEAELGVAIDCDVIMKHTRRSIRIVSTALAVLSLAALGGGIASAAPASTYATDTATLHQAAMLIPTTFSTANDGTYFHTHYQCPDENPFLVLDSVGDNSSQLFRRVTYNTGNGTHLDFTEFAIPVLGPSKAFSAVDIFVQLADSGRVPFEGHKSLTVYCTSTLEAAHQK